MNLEAIENPTLLGNSLYFVSSVLGRVPDKRFEIRSFISKIPSANYEVTFLLLVLFYLRVFHLSYVSNQ